MGDQSLRRPVLPIGDARRSVGVSCSSPAPGLAVRAADVARADAFHYRDEVGFTREVAEELGIEPTVRTVEVSTPEAAEPQRFLGSPSIRIDGRDVEPGADERGGFVLACRIYRTASGQTGLPERERVRSALAAAR